MIGDEEDVVERRPVVLLSLTFDFDYLMMTLIEDDDGEEESNDGDDGRGAFLASHQLVLQICPRIC